MAFLISPGVQVNEIDLTNVIPALATSTGGFAGHFTWGPVGQLVTVSSEKDLITNFGPPDASTARSFLTAASFLKYGNNLKISRAVDPEARNAVGGVAGYVPQPENMRLIRNREEYDSYAIPSQAEAAVITARYPGAAGNSIRVIIARPDNETWQANTPISNIIRQNFSSKPGSTSFAEAYAQNIGALEGSILDEIHVLIIDEKGIITGTPGSVLERYEGLSLASDAKTENGATNYYKNIINNSSNYIYITSLSNSGVVEWSGADVPIAEIYSAAEETVVPVLNSFNTQSFDRRTFAFNEGLGRLSNGVAQVETATVTLSGHGTIPGSTLNVTVTSDLITGSPLVVPVALTTAETTATAVAAKIRSALAATQAIATHYTVSSGGVNYILTAKVIADNDASLNLAHSGLNTGVTPLVTSVNTTEGQLPVLVPRIVSYPDLITDNGDRYSIEITVAKTEGGGALSPSFSEETPVTVTVKIVMLNDSGDPTGTVYTESFNTIIDTNVGADILYYDLKIGINKSDNDGEAIIVEIPKYQTIQSGGGYGIPTAEGLNNIQCSSAVVGSVISPESVTSALEYFSNKETVDVNLIFTETFFQVTDTLASDEYVGSSQQTIDTAITTIVNARKDCVGFISAPLDISILFSDSTKKAHLITKAEALIPSSYVIMDSTPVYVYNKYTDTYVWISACGHMAGLCANADRVADAWFSPAGLNRGGLLGVTKLAYNADQTSRDDIYKLGVNPIVSFPGQGIILYGDKTLQRKPSAFDRINLRRLFITLEKAIATAAKFQLFEQNDDFTRSAFRNAIEPFLRDVQGRRGITDFRVVCDATNNTGEVIDNNNFVADIYIKPTRSINYITLNFIATRTGVEFREIVG